MKRAFSEPMRRSQAQARSKPPPTAAPLIMAMVGFSNRWRPRMIPWILRNPRRNSSAPLGFLSLSLRGHSRPHRHPHKKTCPRPSLPGPAPHHPGPLPEAPGRTPHSIFSFKAFIRSGRFRVKIPIPSFFSSKRVSKDMIFSFRLRPWTQGARDHDLRLTIFSYDISRSEEIKSLPGVPRSQRKISFGRGLPHWRPKDSAETENDPCQNS